MGSLQKYKEPADMITDFSTDKPIHVQILDYCMDCVGDGQWIAGERIPSVKELSVAMVVNPRTVMRAYEALEERGIIFQRRGLGFYVADGAVDKWCRKGAMSSRPLCFRILWRACIRRELQSTN